MGTTDMTFDASLRERFPVGPTTTPDQVLASRPSGAQRPPIPARTEHG